MSRKDSALACIWTIESMLAGKRRCYLWTLTTPDVCSLAEVVSRFASMWDSLRKRYPRLTVVRVFERHPGGHGWHVHFVCASHLWVGWVRRYAERAGFGRINAKRIRADRASYVAKYLNKGYREPEARGRRLWEVCGRAQATFDCTRVGDVVTESPLKEFRRNLRESCPFWLRCFGRERVEQWVDRVLAELSDEGYTVAHWLSEWRSIPWRNFVPIGA